MITKQQAIELSGTREIVHYVGRTDCLIWRGSRGGYNERITRCRVNGLVRIWAQNPEAFRLPVKFGMYEHGEVTDWNAREWHTEADCLVLQAERARSASQTREATVGTADAPVVTRRAPSDYKGCGRCGRVHDPRFVMCQEVQS